MTAQADVRSALLGWEPLPLTIRPTDEDIERAKELVRSLPPDPGSAARMAVLSNLVGLIAHPHPEDHELAAVLPLRLGHQQVAELRGELDSVLDTGPSLPFTTAAIAELSCTARTVERLRHAGRSTADARRVAVDCADGAFWLLMTGVEQSRPAPLPSSPAELRATLERRGADGWRRILANVAHNPWEPGAPYLADLARDAGLPAAAHAIDRCTKLYRERSEDSDRRAIAREIRRLVAISGCSQRQFAQYVGTSGPRLSTYVNGVVTPSATMMLRIKRVAIELERSAARGA